MGGPGSGNWGCAGPTPQPRVAWEPLWELAEGRGWSMLELSRRSGIARRQLYRYRDVGFTEQAADRAAVAVGRVACEVWPDWFDVFPVPDDSRDEDESEAA